MRVLLTGASGLLGTWMRRTTPAEVELVCVEHTTTIAAAQKVALDLRDEEKVRTAVASAAPDAIVHLAYRVDDRASVVDATAGLARSGVPVVFASTESVFRGDDRWRSESDDPDPVRPYGAWKAEGEHAVLRAGGAVVRLPLMCSIEPPDTMTSTIRRAVAEGTSPGWFDQEVRLAAWTEDVADAMWRITIHAEPSGVWHLMGPDPLTRPQLAAALSARLGVTDPGHPVPSPPPEVRPRTLLLSDHRAREQIGWKPRPI